MVPIDTDGAPRFEAGDDGPGAGQDHHRPHHRCRYRQADPPCPGQDPVRQGGRGALNEFEADAEGRFRANPLSADRYEVSAVGSRGAALSGRLEVFDWPKGAVEHSIDLALPRGVVIRGKVTEEGSGKPVAGARISFGASKSDERDGRLERPRGERADGSFQIAVLPGPGYLVVLGPSDDYVLRGRSATGLIRPGRAGRPPVLRPRLHRLRPEAGRREPGRQRHAPPGRDRERPGRRAGRSADPGCLDDQPRLPPRHRLGAWLVWRARHHGSVTSGRFEMHGLDPDAEVPVYFLDPHHKLGATVNLSGKSAAGDRSPSGSSPAAPPRRGWSTPAASRSRGIVRRP